MSTHEIKHDALVCLQRTETIKDLQRQLAERDEKIQQMSHHVQIMEDLNLITPYITKYYNEVFRAVRRNYQNQGKTLEHTNWVEMFSAASAESAQFNDFDIDEKPLNTSISEVMRRLGDLSETDWETLQSVRKDRNNNGHPRLDDDKVVSVIQTRWKEHNAYDALHKMTKYITSSGGRRPRNRSVAKTKYRWLH